MPSTFSRHDDGSATEHVYDDAGRHLRTTDRDPDGNTITDIQYDFDGGRVCGWRVYRGDGSLRVRFESSVDGEGREIEVREYRPNNTIQRIERYEYDTEGRVVVERHYDSRDILRSIGRIRYGEDGLYDGISYEDPQGEPLTGPAA